MKTKIRLLSVLLAVCVLFSVIYFAKNGAAVTAGDNGSLFAGGKVTIRLWYDDEALTDYLLQEAVAFNESHRKIRLEPTLVSALEYLENISSASVEEKEYPDLYILTNDSLEKAYLAGLASPVSQTNILTTDQYPTAALSSVTYQDKYIAYPYYFETSTLLYNKTYLEDAAKEELENEALLAQGEGTASDDSSAAGSSDGVMIAQDAIDARVKEMLPKSITDIISFAESYNAPETVEAVFKWDVSDIFYNYLFVGNYLNLGGSAGDDASQIDIYNENTINCMSLYQQLNQIFAIDSSKSSYDDVIQDFIDGKMVFTLATTDSLKTIKAAQADGKCSYEYGVEAIPNLTDAYKTRTMSVTRCIAVNGYSEHSAQANEVAAWLCSQTSDDMYQMAGKVASNKKVIHDDSNLQGFMDAYETSVPMPKMIATSNFWMQLEISFEKIWDGADPNETLRSVSEQIKTQVTGQETTENSIEDSDNASWTGDSEYYDEGMSE